MWDKGGCAVVCSKVVVNMRDCEHSSYCLTYSLLLTAMLGSGTVSFCVFCGYGFSDSARLDLMNDIWLQKYT